MEKMMRVLITCVVLVLLAGVVCAQQARPAQRIRAAKMAYIKDRLHLSGEQSAKFVPEYKAYEQELRTMRAPYLKKYKLKVAEEGRNTSAWQYLEDDLDYQQEVIALKRKYNDRFLKVLSPNQLSEMHMAEREFRKVLIKRVEDRRGGNGGRRRR